MEEAMRWIGGSVAFATIIIRAIIAIINFKETRKDESRSGPDS